MLCDDDITFLNCSFIDNTASYDTPNILLVRAYNVYFTQCSFSNRNKNSPLTIDIRGFYFQINAESNVMIVDSSLTDGIAK